MMKLGLSLAIKQEELEKVVTVMQRSGWTAEATDWVSRDGVQYDFTRTQETVPEFPGGVLGDIFIDFRS